MINSYATVQEFKNYVTSRGHNATIDNRDDGIIEDLLENASRYLDGETGRQFFPSIESKVFDIPDKYGLFFDGDLLEVLSVTNGDSTTITSTDYLLHAPNETPYYKITLRDISDVEWETNTDSSTQQVITIRGVWGYCEEYTQRGWTSAGTLGAAMSDTTSLTITMTAGHTLTAGKIIKIDTEFFNIDTINNLTVTVNKRGDNGSTAATHSNSATVYVWNPDARAKKAVLDQANSDYAERYGNNDQTGSKTATEIELRGSARSMRDLIRLLKRVT